MIQCNECGNLFQRGGWHTCADGTRVSDKFEDTNSQADRIEKQLIEIRKGLIRIEEKLETIPRAIASSSDL